MILDPRRPFGLAVGAASLLGFVYLVAPILVIVAAAFGSTGYLAFPPQGFTWRWYEAALASPRYLGAFATSLAVAALTTLLATTIGVAAALALVRRRLPGAALLEAMFLSPLMLPSLVLAVALTMFFSRLGVPGGMPRLVAAHVVICTPYVLRVTLPVLRRFDRALEEAALNLGATPFTAFRRVTLPVVRPGIVAGAVLAFITSFDEVVLALFLADPRRPTLPVTIYSSVQLGFEPSVAAVSALLVLLAALFMALYQLALGHRR